MGKFSKQKPLPLSSSPIFQRFIDKKKFLPRISAFRTGAASKNKCIRTLLIPCFLPIFTHAPAYTILLQCISLEEKEQVKRYSLDQQHTLKQLKAEGLALHPIIVMRKSFGYADYPEISFKLSFPPEANMFKDGAAIECFMAGEEPVKGVLISLDGKTW
jgi:hypothetical protein